MRLAPITFASITFASITSVGLLFVACVGEEAAGPNPLSDAGGVQPDGGGGLPDGGAVTDAAPIDSGTITDAGPTPPPLVNCQDAGVWAFSTPGWNGDGVPCTAGDGGYTNCDLTGASAIDGGPADGGSAVRARSGDNVPALKAPLNQVVRLKFSLQVNASNGTYEADIAFVRRDEFFGYNLQLASAGATRTILLAREGSPPSPIGTTGVGSMPLELTLYADSTWVRLGSGSYVKVTADPVGSNPRFQLGPYVTVGAGINLGATYSPIATELCSVQ